MSTANPVPETCGLTGSDAKETLAKTGRTRLLRDAFERLRASDGFSHARSMAFVTSLILVQGVIALVGLASVLGAGRVSDAIVGMLQDVFPGPAGAVLTDAVKQAHEAGAQNRSLALTLGLVGAHRHGDHAAGPDRARDESPLRRRARPPHLQQVRPRVRAHDQRRSARGRRLLRDDARARDRRLAVDDPAAQDVWNVVRWPLGVRSADRRDRVHLPLEPTPPPARLVLARVRRAPVGRRWCSSSRWR